MRGRIQRLTSAVVTTTVVTDSGKPSTRPTVSSTSADACTISSAEITSDTNAPIPAARQGGHRPQPPFGGFAHPHGQKQRLATRHRDRQQHHAQASAEAGPTRHQQVEERLGLAGEANQQQSSHQPAAAAEELREEDESHQNAEPGTVVHPSQCGGDSADCNTNACSTDVRDRDYTRRVIVLGIDPGTAQTGFGAVAVTGSRLRALEHGVITTKAADPIAERLAVIFDHVAELIDRLRPMRWRWRICSSARTLAPSSRSARRAGRSWPPAAGPGWRPAATLPLRSRPACAATAAPTNNR